jgi:hypothetical protein
VDRAVAEDAQLGSLAEDLELLLQEDDKCMERSVNSGLEVESIVTEQG